MRIITYQAYVAVISGRPQIYRKQTSSPVMGYGGDSRVYTADVR